MDEITAETGELYTYDTVPFFFYHRGPALNAAPGTGVRAGMLKCAIDEHGMTPGVERVMRAVAAAHHRTGVPVTVHTHPGTRTATFEARADTLAQMCRRGYAERMVLSQDESCYIDWIDPNVMPFLPQWHYLHIHHEVLPYARARVTGEQIATMLTANPRRFFEKTD